MQTDQRIAQAPADQPPAPRWVLWSGIIASAAVLGGLFAVWGINGPTYLFDLIAAYCF